MRHAEKLEMKFPEEWLLKLKNKLIQTLKSLKNGN
jgi:hypothetical protein